MIDFINHNKDDQKEEEEDLNNDASLISHNE